MRRELAYRASDGVEVWLHWHSSNGRLTVRVDDARTKASFELEARRDNALDVFYHPYVYASDYSANAAARLSGPAMPSSR